MSAMADRRQEWASMEVDKRDHSIGLIDIGFNRVWDGKV
jgi:hypothetical protein